jgi:2-iminobutanoate/2-iminopropanoate deaminase
MSLSCTRSLRAGLIAIASCFILSCNVNEDQVRQMVRDEMSKAIERKIVVPVQVVGPYSPAVRIGGFLFVSGQIGIDQESGQIRSDNIEVETRQVLDNISTILRSEGYDSSEVVSATVYLKDMEDYQKMNLIYGGYFEEGNYPARSTVEVTNLPRGANVEISLVAYKR